MVGNSTPGLVKYTTWFLIYFYSLFRIFNILFVYKEEGKCIDSRFLVSFFPPHTCYSQNPLRRGLDMLTWCQGSLFIETLSCFNLFWLVQSWIYCVFGVKTSVLCVCCVTWSQWVTNKSDNLFLVSLNHLQSCSGSAGAFAHTQLGKGCWWELDWTKNLWNIHPFLSPDHFGTLITSLCLPRYLTTLICSRG